MVDMEVVAPEVFLMAVYRYLTTVTRSANTITFGAGGSGGFSSGMSGAVGAAGQVN
jgi:hypothetical protein